MAARNPTQALSGTTDGQRECARAGRCEAKTRDADGGWHPKLTYQAYCPACTSRITACAAELPALYGYLHAGGAPARSSRPVRTAPASRVLINPVTDALLRDTAAQTAGWAARIRSVPGLSLSPPEHPHGTPERVREDCKNLALHPGPLLALAHGPLLRLYPWPLTPEEETRLGDCQIASVGDDWVHVLEFLDGAAAGAEILDLHWRARKLTGQAPAPRDLLDGIPCRSCEAMSSLEVMPAEPPDPEKPPPLFCRCSVPGCGDEMTRAEYDEWVRMYEAWTRGAGVLTCRRCELRECRHCQWAACGCRKAGHPQAA